VVYFSIKTKRLSVRNIVSVFIVVALLLVATPVGDMIKQRTEAAAIEVTNFYTENKYVSSVGTRLAMWDIAIDVWQQHPVLGTGPGDFDDEVVALQKIGEYTGMPIHNSVHNIYIQALVGSGIVGLITLILVVFIMPLKIFFNKEQDDKDGSLAGFITIISFAVFGFSESWTLRLPVVSVFLVYIIVIASHLRIVNSKSNN
jgi:O-antigen ligase